MGASGRVIGEAMRPGGGSAGARAGSPFDAVAHRPRTERQLPQPALMLVEPSAAEGRQSLDGHRLAGARGKRRSSVGPEGGWTPAGDRDASRVLSPGDARRTDDPRRRDGPGRDGGAVCEVEGDLSYGASLRQERSQQGRSRADSPAARGAGRRRRTVPSAASHPSRASRRPHRGTPPGRRARRTAGSARWPTACDGSASSAAALGLSPMKTMRACGSLA